MRLVALKITFYVIKLMCLTDTLYFICIDKHIGMTNVKKKLKCRYTKGSQKAVAARPSATSRLKN